MVIMKCFPWFGFIFSKARDRVDGSIKTGDLQKSEGYLRCTRFPILSIKNCSIKHAHVYPFISMLNSNICPFVNVMPTDQKSFLKAQLCRLTPFIFSIFPRFHSSSSALGIPLKANKEFPWESPVYKEQIFSGTFPQLTNIAVRLGFKQRHNCCVFFQRVPSFREACDYQNGWIFGKVPNGLWPPFDPFVTVLPQVCEFFLL